MITDKALPPTLGGHLPLLGHSLALLRRRHDFFVDAHTAGPLVGIRLGSRTLYLVNDLGLIRRVLTTDASSYGRGELFERVRPYLGDALPFVDGRPHRNQRRIVLPAFHRNAVAEYVTAMAAVAGRRISRWRDGDHILMGEQFRNLAMEFAGAALFSFDFTEALLRDWHAITPAFTKGLFLRVAAPYPWLERLPLPVNRRFTAAAKWVRELCDRITDAHPLGATDLISLLTDAVDADTGEPLSRAQVSTEILGMLIAATENTGVALSWCCLLLAGHPEVQDRVRAEIDEVLGGRACTAADLPSLTYTWNALKEAVRLYPPLFFWTRAAQEPVELGGFRLPPGSSLLLSPYGLHRAPEYFPEPLTFAPERWMDGGELSAVPEAFLAFGAGLHHCLGEHLSMTEGVVVLTTLLSRFELRLADGEIPRSKAGALLTPGPARIQLRALDARLGSHRAERIVEENR